MTKKLKTLKKWYQHLSNSEFMSNAIEELAQEYDHKSSFSVSWLFDDLDKKTQIKMLETIRNQQVLVKEYGTEFESTSDEDFAIESFQFGITRSMIDRFIGLDMPLAQSQKELEELKVLKV